MPSLRPPTDESSGSPSSPDSLFLALILFAALGAAACPKKDTSASAAPVVTGSPSATEPGPGVRAHPGGLPRECESYRRALETCMANPAFPSALLAHQKLALDQMMLGLRTDDLPAAERPAARAAAAQNCQDSLNTLRESSKETCPGLF